MKIIVLSNYYVLYRIIGYMFMYYYYVLFFAIRYYRTLTYMFKKNRDSFSSLMNWAHSIHREMISVWKVLIHCYYLAIQINYTIKYFLTVC